MLSWPHQSHSFCALENRIDLPVSFHETTQACKILQPCQSFSGLPTMEASLMLGQLQRAARTGKKN